MAKGRFNIKGTKDFLVAAVFCGFLCIWSIRDAWFPTAKVLKKHPREIPVAFKVSGVVKHIAVQPGDEIKGKVLLAALHDETYRAKAAAAEAAFEAAKAVKDPAVEEKLAVLMQARADLDACTIENTDITWTTTHGDELLRGKVARIMAEPSTQLEAGVPVLAVNPVDTFYMFNKTLAALTFLGMIASLIFHGIASH
jgi:pyruvate/2-oxoglutarate dehydrogenase complex dihydrolipoamide acyltransferase (E2) component